MVQDESRGRPIKCRYICGWVGSWWCIIYLFVSKLHHSYNTLQNHTWIYLICIIYIDLPIYVHAYMNTYTWWFSMFEIIDPVWYHGPSGAWKRMIEDRFWSKKTWLRLSSHDALETEEDQCKRLQLPIGSFFLAKNWSLHLQPLENIVTPRVQWMSLDHLTNTTVLSMANKSQNHQVTPTWNNMNSNLAKFWSEKHKVFVPKGVFVGALAWQLDGLPTPSALKSAPSSGREPDLGVGISCIQSLTEAMEIQLGKPMRNEYISYRYILT